MAIAGHSKSARVNKLRDAMVIPPEVCIERARFMTESYRETEGEPTVIRRAKAMRAIMEKMSVQIHDGELIVGTLTSKRRGSALVPELRVDWLLKEMDGLSTREWDKYSPLKEDEKARMREFLPYWKGKAAAEKWRALLPENALRLNHKICTGVSHAEQNFHHGHMCVDYDRVVAQGLNSVRKQVGDELQKLDLAEAKNLDKYHFLTAVNICLDAVDHLANRYAELARKLAAAETDQRRKAELERIAAACSWVPANPARTFQEGLQAAWFTYLAIMVEGWGASIPLGRMDQYLYPLYDKDIKNGVISKAEARELLATFLIKIAGQVIVQSEDIVRNTAGFFMGVNVIIGGMTPSGRDAVNELSYLFLDAEEDVRLSSEDFVVRVNKQTPEAFVIRACEVAKSLSGKVKFLSDDTYIQGLLDEGKPLEHARNYVIGGCFHAIVPAFARNQICGFYNLPLMLELALNNGISRVTGEQLGPQTGDPRKFRSYEEVWQAYKKQLEALMPVASLIRNADMQAFAENCHTPFQSCLFQGCIEKGLDANAGGTHPYDCHSMGMAGAPNVGDSLAAIKKCVFEDKKITMPRLIEALDRNFEGENDILHVLASAPKFGNDDDYVDMIVNEVILHANSTLASHKSYSGAICRAAVGTATTNVPLGYFVGALPDGRRSREPLAEGGISPHQGRNVSGPTATMRSVAKLDLSKCSGGSVLNMRFNPDAVKDAAKMRKFASLIRTFCETGGGLVQFNFVSTVVLRDAQKHPEKYRDLLVRVSTYSAYFVELGAELQNDIIARMEFEEV